MPQTLSHTDRGRLRLLASLSVVVAVMAVLILGAPARAAGTFHFRVHGGLGLVPPVDRQGRLSTADIASGALTPETYHGGPVMNNGVTVHTIFWAPAGHPFQGSPGSGSSQLPRSHPAVPERCRR